MHLNSYVDDLVPTVDVAKAEELASKGEVVVSPTVISYLRNNSIIASELESEVLADGFYKVVWKNCPSAVEISNLLEEEFSRRQGTTTDLIDDLMSSSHHLGASMYVDDDNTVVTKKTGNTSLWNETGIMDKQHQLFLDDKVFLEEAVFKILECHRHEATRDAFGKFSAELRRVAIVFIKIDYEPELSHEFTKTNEDEIILKQFQAIFSTISDVTSAYNGQIRQFISDDKGTVCIISFGLRKSTTLNPSAAAIDASYSIRAELMQQMNIKCTIGCTIGKVFCGETGSYKRNEYSILGPSVNLSARLMSKGKMGQINVDEEINRRNDGHHGFELNGTHVLKGYEAPVPFFSPVLIQNDPTHNRRNHNNPSMFYVRHKEILELVSCFKEQLDRFNDEAKEGRLHHPFTVLVSGRSGEGKTKFVDGVLNESSVKENYVLLEGNNSSSQNNPFHFWIPIIVKIVLHCGEVRSRLVKLRKKTKKYPPILKHLLRHNFMKSPCETMQAFELVPAQLFPNLCILNDLIFQGFPVLEQSKDYITLKNEDKIEIGIKVLCAIVTRHVEIQQKPSILFIDEIVGIDDYSKLIVKQLYNSQTRLILIGTYQKEETMIKDIDSFHSFFGSYDVQRCVEINLKLLSKDAIFDLFLSSLNDMDEEDRKLLNQNEIIDDIYHLCGGMTLLTVELANAVNAQWKRSVKSIPNSKPDRLIFFRSLLNDVPTAIEDLVCFRFDKLTPDAQMILKVASVAGLDKYSFSQNLLEYLILATAKNQRNGSKQEKHKVHIPTHVGTSEDYNQITDMFQGDNFEVILGK